VAIVGGLAVNSWRSKETIQIMIRDLACGHFQCLDYRDRTAYEEAAPQLSDGAGTLLFDDRFVWQNRPYAAQLKSLRPGTVVLAPTLDAAELRRTLTKEGFGAWFRLLAKQEAIAREAFRDLVAAPAWAADAAIAVFAELGFITVADDQVRAVKNAEKKNLTDSKIYLELLATAEELIRLGRLTSEQIAREFRALLEE
jgi:hypothetical protein